MFNLRSYLLLSSTAFCLSIALADPVFIPSNSQKPTSTSSRFPLNQVMSPSTFNQSIIQQDKDNSARIDKAIAEQTSTMPKTTTPASPTTPNNTAAPALLPSTPLNAPPSNASPAQPSLPATPPSTPPTQQHSSPYTGFGTTPPPSSSPSKNASGSGWGVRY